MSRVKDVFYRTKYRIKMLLMSFVPGSTLRPGDKVTWFDYDNFLKGTEKNRPRFGIVRGRARWKAFFYAAGYKVETGTGDNSYTLWFPRAELTMGWVTKRNGGAI